ncbi:hypothetical protein E0J76_11585 [Neisseria gonorrhoeae]
MPRRQKRCFPAIRRDSGNTRQRLIFDLRPKGWLRNGRPRPPCKPLKDKPPGLIRVAVENHLPFDLFEI